LFLIIAQFIFIQLYIMT